MYNLQNIFKNVFPNCKDLSYADRIESEAADRNFNKQQMCMFLAQTGHESAGFTRFVENLNYSKKALLTTFPKYFPTETIAEVYARKPEKIANKIYANRMGNGSTCSGDGWKYRGRGIIQITGKNNYRKLEYDTNIQCVKDPDILLNSLESVKSAFWYWDINNLASISDINLVTRKINGGLNGIDDRKNLYCKIYGLME